MAQTLIAKVASLNITPKGGDAMAITGVRTATLSKNFGAQEDYDPDDEVPFHWRGNVSETIALTLRDYQLAIALWSMPCVTALTCVMNAPRSLCAAGDSAAITVTGSNLVVDGDIQINASPEGVPTEYTVTFKASHVDGVAGSLVIT